MKLLLIEDSEALAAGIKRMLKGDYTVDMVHTGGDAINRARQADYGMVLLDLGLPDMNGYDVCLNLREYGIGTPILVLSGRKDIASRVRLLECGADDFLTKPFDSDELQARIHALLRRSLRGATSQEVSIADMTLDVRKRAVQRNGQPIDLRRKEFDILYYLVRNRGRAVSRDMIISNVWEADKENYTNTVDVHIKNLRDKVDKPFERRLIKTAYGVGYKVDEP